MHLTFICACILSVSCEQLIYSTKDQWTGLDTKKVGAISSKNDSLENRSRNLRTQGPYYYDPPQYIPPFGDEIPSAFTTKQPEDGIVITPPSSDDVSHSYGYSYEKPDIPFDLQPPFSDEIPEIPPQYLPSKGATVRSRNFNQIKPLQLEINEMNCYDTQTDGKFQTVLTFKSKNENVPVFEDATQHQNCAINSDEIPPKFNTRIQLNISKRNFHHCGIKNCSPDESEELLCVRLRFPTVNKMRLPEDAVLTLQCKMRDKIAVHTKHLQFEVANSASARSGGVVAKGGGKGSLRSRALLFRKGARGDYNEVLPPHARVPLGDTLMLRADVEPGDGWTSSRLSTVSMRGSGELNEELVLLKTDGCRSLQARGLCPRDPIAVTPLQHTLLIRAALFDGMHSGEEMRLSVRMVACLEAKDCNVPSCEPGFQISRSKRSISNDQMANSTSEISFKVVLPQIMHESDSTMPKNGVVVMAIVVVGAVVLCLIILLVLKINKLSIT